jgi:hypothetical protein
VEEFAKIRRIARVEGFVDQRLGEAIRCASPHGAAGLGVGRAPARKTPERAAPKLETVRDLIDGMLRQDIDAPRKQRQTATRIWRRLLDECCASLPMNTLRHTL